MAVASAAAATTTALSSVGGIPAVPYICARSPSSPSPFQRRPKTAHAVDNCCSTSGSAGSRFWGGIWSGLCSNSGPQPRFRSCTAPAAGKLRPAVFHISASTYFSNSAVNRLGGSNSVTKQGRGGRLLDLSLSFSPSNASAQDTRNVLRQRRRGHSSRRPKAKEDDFEIDDDGGFDTMDMADIGEEEEEDFRDYETEYEAPIGYRPFQKEADSFISTEGGEEETVVAWKINEDEFHKISLLTCDFFIRKVPDPDEDVYDFREMYVTPPDTDVYSIPKVNGKLPRKPIRCNLSNYEYIHTTEPPVDEPRAPLAKTEFEVMKVFLMRHLKDRRTAHEDFMLDFEEIYVIDSKRKSFSRANVQIDVPGGRNRDRTHETLIVRDDGTTFRIIPEEEQRSPDELVHALHWEKTREAMENYLRGFRDYEKSNWF